MKQEINAKQTTINRLRQAAASETEELIKLDDELKSLRQSLEDHRDEARAGHHHFVEVTEHCEKEWKIIIELEAKPTSYFGRQ